MVKTKLDYYNGSNEIPEGGMRISASSFNGFMTRPHQWYREQILGEEGFTGNTASVLGTCVHYIAECYAKGEHPEVNEIEQYITNNEKNENVDCDIVRSQYKDMGNTLVNQYIAKHKPDRVEEFITHEILPGYFVGGSCDGVQGSMIIDYKTYNSKTKPKAIPMNYKYQLLIYAYVYKKLGVNIDRIRLVYINRFIDGGISPSTNRPLKSYPPEVTVLTEVIDDNDLDFIESVLLLCVESVMKVKEDPSLAYLIFKDYRLKEK